MCLRKLRPRETDLATYADSQRPIQKWVKIEFWHLKTRPSQTDMYRMSMSPEEVFLSLRVIAKPQQKQKCPQYENTLLYEGMLTTSEQVPHCIDTVNLKPMLSEKSNCRNLQSQTISVKFQKYPNQQYVSFYIHLSVIQV